MFFLFDFNFFYLKFDISIFITYSCNLLLFSVNFFKILKNFPIIIFFLISLQNSLLLFFLITFSFKKSKEFCKKFIFLLLSIIVTTKFLHLIFLQTSNQTLKYFSLWFLKKSFTLRLSLNFVIHLSK